MNAIADSTGIILDIHVPPNGETWGTNTVSYLFQFYEMGCCTSPQSFIIKFSYSLAQQLWGLLMNLIGWFIKLSVQTLQQLIVIYIRGIFVY